MPYTKGNPPDRIKKLPKHAQEIWVSAFNSALKQYEDEGKANAVAWAAVKKQYKKVGDKWQKKGSDFMDKSIFRDWTTKYVNDLPDSSFAYIMPGGEKDEEGKTTPRGLRKLPYKDKDGNVDLPHLRNAIARAPQTKGIPSSKVKSIQDKLRKILEKKTRGSEIIVNPIELSEVANEIEILKTGEWDHPSYGPIKVKDEDLEEFVKNFNKGVRNDLPINVEHKSTEGAVGWFRKIYKKGKSLFAKVEWTKKGRQLLKDKVFKYFSPEFYSTYDDPETRKIYKNVLVGGALTNTPYFKGLSAIVFSDLTNKHMELKDILQKEVKDLTDEEKKVLKEKTDELTDEQKKKFQDVLEDEGDDESGDEGGDEGESNEGEGEEGEEGEEGSEGEDEGESEGDEDKKVEMSEAKLKILERNAKEGMKAAAELRKQKAQEYVKSMTFSESNPKGIILPKSSDKVVSFLLSLSSNQVEKFKELINELPKPKSGIFGEVGKNEFSEDDAQGKVNQLVESKMKENDKLKYREALDAVLAENPELAKEVTL